MISAISVWAYPNTSWSTNTARSSGDSDSRTTSIASDTDSVRSAGSSAPVSSVTRGSGSHGPTYVSRRRLTTARRFRAWLTAIRTR